MKIYSFNESYKIICKTSEFSRLILEKNYVVNKEIRGYNQERVIMERVQ